MVAKKAAAKRPAAKRVQRTPSTPGPKPKFGETLDRIGVTIDDMTRRKLSVIGGGNISEGVRIAADREYDRYQKNDEAGGNRLSARGSTAA